MRMKTLFALLICVCLFPFCAAPAEGEVTLTVGDQTFSAPGCVDVLEQMLSGEHPSEYFSDAAADCLHLHVRRHPDH